MPILSNPKHELFAQEIAKGVPASQAYVNAGYAKNDSNSSRLNGNDRVKARVQELLEASAEKAGVTIDRIVNELAKIGFANAADFFSWGPDGVRIKPSDDLTRDQMAVVAEVQETRAKAAGENTIKVKLSDKQAALEKLGRHLGMFKDRSEVDVNLTAKESTPRERIASRIAVLSARGGTGGDTGGTE